MADKAVIKARKVVVKAAKKIADLYPKLDPASDKKFPVLASKLSDAYVALQEALTDLDMADSDAADEVA